MKRRSSLTVVLAASALLGAAGLSGCGGGASGTPELSATSPPPTSSTVASTPSSSSSSTTLGPGAPGVPANARANTEAAAIAFVKYFKKTYDALQVSPKAGVVPTMSLPSCKTCVNYEQTMVELVRDKQHFDKPGMIPKRFERSPFSDSMWIAMWGDRQANIVVDDHGSLVVPADKKPMRNVALVYQLAWTAEGWRIGEVQIDEGRAQPWT